MLYVSGNCMNTLINIALLFLTNSSIIEIYGQLSNTEQADPVKSLLIGKWALESKTSINGKDTTIQYANAAAGGQKTATSRPLTEIVFDNNGNGFITENFYCVPFLKYNITWSLRPVTIGSKEETVISVKLNLNQKSLKWVEEEFSGSVYFIDNSKLTILNKNGSVYNFVR